MMAARAACALGACLLFGSAARSDPVPDADRTALQARLQTVLEAEASGVERSFRTPLAVVTATPFPAFSRRTRAPCGNCGDPCRPYQLRYQLGSALEIAIIEGARCRTADGRWVPLEERVVGKIDLRPQVAVAPPPPAPPPQPAAPVETVRPAPPPVQPPPPPPPWRPDPEAVGLLDSLRYLDAGTERPDRPTFERAVSEFARDRNLSPAPSGADLVATLHNAAVREFALAPCLDGTTARGALCRR